MEIFLITLFIFMAFVASGISFGILFKPIKASCGGINCKCMRNQ